LRYTEKVSLLSKESTPENVIQCCVTIYSHIRAPVVKRDLLFDDPKGVPLSSVLWGKERFCLRIAQLGP